MVKLLNYSNLKRKPLLRKRVSQSISLLDVWCEKVKKE